MKTRLITLLALVALFVSCGKNELPTDGVFGDVPAQVLDFNAKKAEFAKNVKEGSGSMEDLKKLFADFKDLNKAFEVQMDQATETYKGKEIPTEVDKNVFIKFDKPFSIEKVDHNGTICIVAEGELTAEGSSVKGKGVIDYGKLGIVLQNAESENFYAYHLFQMGIEGERNNDLYPKGTKIKYGAYIRVKPWNVENMANAKSLIVTSTDRDLFTQAQKADKDAEKAIDEAAKALKGK